MDEEPGGIGGGGGAGKGGVGAAAGDDASAGAGHGGTSTSLAGAGAGGAGGERSGASGGGGEGTAGGEGGNGGGGGAPGELPDGLLEPIPYLSRADSPFDVLTFGDYFYLEDWSDGALNTPGVSASDTTLGSSFGAAFVDSIDGDDGMVDGICAAASGTCDDGWASGTITFTFDPDALAALPTHVGIAWTDGSAGCDAIFQAYDAEGALIGARTAPSVGDGDNNGGVAEDRFFGVVHRAGVKSITVQSSSGGVEVDHLQYGR